MHNLGLGGGGYPPLLQALFKHQSYSFVLFPFLKWIVLYVYDKIWGSEMYKHI